jgi:dihydropteroate synthase
MGVLNVTPDSFSDGGVFDSVDAAVARGIGMTAEGADIIDVGGESTRPGAERVSAAEQKERVLPVIEALRRVLPAHIPISIDTTRADVAAAALDAGAMVLNDVSAGRDDPGMFELAAARDVPIVLMHMQGSPATMQDDPQYRNVVEEVLDFLVNRAEAAISLGVQPDAIIVDPGIGFGKQQIHNLQLLAGLQRLAACGYPVLLGTSRKRFLRTICRKDSPTELAAATAATTALGVAAGVRLFRVHDVKANRDAADVAWAIRGASSP